MSNWSTLEGNLQIFVVGDMWICPGRLSSSAKVFVVAGNRALASVENMHILEVAGPGVVELEPKVTGYQRLCEVPILTAGVVQTRTGYVLKGAGRVACSVSPKTNPFPWTWTVIAYNTASSPAYVALTPPFDINAVEVRYGNCITVSCCMSSNPL